MTGRGKSKERAAIPPRTVSLRADALNSVPPPQGLPDPGEGGNQNEEHSLLSRQNSENGSDISIVDIPHPEGIQSSPAPQEGETEDDDDAGNVPDDQPETEQHRETDRLPDP